MNKKEVVIRDKRKRFYLNRAYIKVLDFKVGDRIYVYPFDDYFVLSKDKKDDFIINSFLFYNENINIHNDIIFMYNIQHLDILLLEIIEDGASNNILKVTKKEVLND